MLRIFVLVIMFIGAISFAASFVQGAGEKKKPTNWQPIVGFKSPGAKAFIDTNSTEIVEVDSRNKYTTSEILISYDTPTEVVVGGKKYSVRSMARHLVVECTTGLLAPVFDVYFTEAIPTRDSNPVTGVEWPTDVKLTSTILSKSSVLYSALCPNYI